MPAVEVARTSTHDTIFVATRLYAPWTHNNTCYKHARSSKEGDANCLRQASRNLFIMDPENVTIGLTSVLMFQHGGQLQTVFPNQGTSFPRFAQHHDGSVRPAVGAQVQGFDGFLPPNANVRDWFTLGTLLEMAGVRLSDPDPEGDTFRRAGLNLDVIMQVRHDVYGMVNQLTYKVKYLPLESRLYHFTGGQLDATGRTAELVMEQRRGVRIRLRIEGNAGDISFTNFMVALVASIALLGVIDSVVLCLMLYVLPLRAIYWEYIFEHTVDFSDLKAGKMAAVTGVNEVLAKNATLSGADEIKSYVAKPESAGHHWDHRERRTIPSRDANTGSKTSVSTYMQSSADAQDVIQEGYDSVRSMLTSGGNAGAQDVTQEGDSVCSMVTAGGNAGARDVIQEVYDSVCSKVTAGRNAGAQDVIQEGYDSACSVVTAGGDAAAGKRLISGQIAL
eukprot:TRINITY_DN7829_c0_g1_i5.p1 TRINITY_DN7829_c0_g1~~TRINITY_DN7829_c0_g1_i5.p1  ORF type:complete len:503 (-),score=26.97 TRINITY_DN7829_c0_g1_i5:234-1577(-)